LHAGRLEEGPPRGNPAGGVNSVSNTNN